MSTKKEKVKAPYPSVVEFLSEAVPHLVRGPLYAAALLNYVVRPYVFPALIDKFKSVDLSFLPSVVTEWFNPPGAPTHTTLRDVAFFVTLGVAIHGVLYFGCNTTYVLMDKFNILAKYRLPRTKRMLPSSSLITRTVVEGAISQTLIQPVTLFFIMIYISRFPKLFEAELPSTFQMPLLETFQHFFMCQIVNETMFYFAHRLFHVPVLYKAIHKKHHEYVGTIGFAAEYAHPIEQVAANQVPTVFYSLLWNSNAVGMELAFTWLAWRLYETYEAHSGYCFEGSFLHKLGLLNTHQAKFHDWHHTDNRGNFGAGWIDYPLGTMDSWAEKLHNDKKTKEGKAE